MQKIPTLFVRDPEDRAHVTSEVNPGCEWVLAGEGVATRKYDGTCVMLGENDLWWARREVKAGKATPTDFVATDLDEVTGKTQGWEPIEQSPFAKFHAEALENYRTADQRTLLGQRLEMGTYELLGPKINGNHEVLRTHNLIRHQDALTFCEHLPDFHRDVDYIVKNMRVCDGCGWEGVVWHHPDGRMVKLKVRDFAWVDLL